VVPFQFRLEKVLAWRRTELELAENRYRRQMVELAGLDHALAEFQSGALDSEKRARQFSPLLGRDLAALSEFRRHARHQEQTFVATRQQVSRRVAERQQEMTEALRKCRLLERLKQRRLAEWQGAADKELEQLAAESHLARLARER
jgi:hypothetical protein